MRALLLIVMFSSCAAPVTLRQWKADSGEVSLTVALNGYQSGPDKYQQESAYKQAQYYCQSQVQVKEEGTFLTGNSTRVATVQENPNTPWGPSASGIGATIQERGYYWVFKCTEAP